MKKVLPKIERLNLSKDIKNYMKKWRSKQFVITCNDFAKRQDNLRNHVRKDMMSDNLYILICTALFSIVLFAIIIIGFLLSANLIVKIIWI